MRKEIVGLLVVLCCGALLAGGCAKKEMVKGEEGIPAAKPAEATPAKPAGQGQVAEEQPMKPAPTVKEEPLQAQAQAQAESALQNVYFDFDSYVLSQAARDTLSKDAEYLSKNKGSKVQVEGYTDERGTDEYNLALGEKRAKAALNYLVTLGVPAETLSFISFGEEKPADPGHDEAAWAKNRRVEFRVMK